MLLKKVKQYLSLIVPFRLVDDHGPRLGHLDGRVIGDCDERGPFSNIFVASLEATPKAVSPPFTSASSAQLSTLRRRRGIRCSGLVTLALPATACHTFSARVLHPPASRPREGCHPSSSAGCCAPPHQFSSGLRSGLPSSSQRREFSPPIVTANVRGARLCSSGTCSSMRGYLGRGCGGVPNRANDLTPRGVTRCGRKTDFFPRRLLLRLSRQLRLLLLLLLLWSLQLPLLLLLLLRLLLLWLRLLGPLFLRLRFRKYFKCRPPT